MIIVTDNSLTIHSFNDDKSFNMPDSALLTKCIKSNNENQFFILVSGDLEVFNPLDSSHIRMQKDYERGGLKYKLKRCKEQTYNEYVRFLHSKNRVDYVCAQRSYING